MSTDVFFGSGPWLVVGDLTDGKARCWGEESRPHRDAFAALQSACDFEHSALRDFVAGRYGWVPGSARLVLASDWGRP